MTGTAKTALIVGGVAVGAFVLLKLLTPSPVVAGLARQQQSGAISLSGLADLAGSVAGLFGSSGGSRSFDWKAFDGGAYSDSASQSVLSGFGDSYTVTDGFMFDNGKGGFIAG